jgi:hypothetical protein
VSGAAALLAAAWPNASPVQIKTALPESVDLLSVLTNKVSTHGRPNVGRAMDYLTGTMTSTPTLPPVSVARSGSCVILSWPTNAASAVLEQTPTLPSLPQGWTAVSVRRRRTERASQSPCHWPTAPSSASAVHEQL